MPSRDHGPVRAARDQERSRDQGEQRIRAVTIGLAAASVAGTLAVGAAAWAKESDKAPADNPAPPAAPGPDASGAPDGSAAPPAPQPGDQPPTDQQPADSPKMQPPPGDVNQGSGSGRATSGGT